MNTPIPPLKNPFAPSASTGGSAFGAALAVLVIMDYHAHGVDFPAGAEAAIAVVISTVTGYISEILVCLLKKFGIEPPSPGV
jgi:hypothetical protein